MSDNLIPRSKAEGLSSEPFQMQDIRKYAEQLIRRGMEVANQKVAAAERLAKELEETARKEGYEKGFAEGKIKGEEDGKKTGGETARATFQEEVQPILPLLEQLVNYINGEKLALKARAESDLLALSLAIAEMIVRREISLDDRIALATLQDAISLTASRSDLVLRLNPQDRILIESELHSLHNAFTDLGHVQLETDEAIERGGVIVVGREGEIDMRLTEQLAAIERSLLGLDAKTDTAEVFRPPFTAESSTPDPALTSPAPSTDLPPPTENLSRKNPLGQKLSEEKLPEEKSSAESPPPETGEAQA